MTGQEPQISIGGRLCQQCGRLNCLCGRATVRQPSSSDETHHTDHCEAKYAPQSGAWTPCKCAERAAALPAWVAEVQAPTDRESADAPYNPDVWELRHRIDRLIDALAAAEKVWRDRVAHELFEEAKSWQAVAGGNRESNRSFALGRLEGLDIAQTIARGAQ